MIETTINGRWSIKLPPHRANLEQWKAWEVVRLASMRDNLKPGDVLYDIGSEECDLSGLYSSWGAELVMVEPSARIWANAKSIWAANNLDEPLGFFTGFACDEDRDVAHGFSKSWPRSADGSIVTDHGFCQVYERPDLAAVRLDTLVELVGQPPDVVSMDVEGSELLVLRGAEMTLRNHRPRLWASIHPAPMSDFYKHRVVDLKDFLRSCGYEWRWIDVDHEIHMLAWFSDGRRPELPWD
jgi:FkbM family methyltransferase